MKFGVFLAKYAKYRPESMQIDYICTTMWFIKPEGHFGKAAVCANECDPRAGIKFEETCFHQCT